MNSRLISAIFLLLCCSYVYGQQNLRRAFQPANVVYKTPYGNNPQAGHYVQAKDTKIYYEVYGKGQSIVNKAIQSNLNAKDFNWNIGLTYSY